MSGWWQRISVWTLIAVVGSYVGVVDAQGRGGQRTTPVVVEQVKFENEISRIEAVGTAEAAKSVVLFPAVGDIVTAIHFIPGQLVEQNDILLELDARRQRVAVNRAEIQLRDAERTVERLRTSRSQGAIPESDLDDAVTLRDLLEVDLAEAKANLEDRLVRAPFDGVVGLTDVEVGDRITEQTAITTLDKRDELLINFRAPEAALSVLSQNPELSVQPWENRSVQIPAEIAEVDSRVSNENRTLRVRARLNNEDDRFRPGMSFRVRLQVAGDSYAVVPEAALLWGATGAYVWIVEESAAKRVDVQIKQRLAGRLLVAGELQPGDELIVEGVQQLREGQAVSYESSEGDRE
ncbi:efflux RND transporter periplasmic adaptor subunit [Aliidiomarina sp. Khilg15.8]